ncbi:DNA-formamidopyrimidine glycosylase family protein [Gemmatimonadota bacterium]
MFEHPEYTHLAAQINQTLTGKVVRDGDLGNSPHKFVWYNRSSEDFAKLVRGKTVGSARVLGRFMMVDLTPGYVLSLGECGGRILFHEAGSSWPKKRHLSLTFTDDSFFTITTSMWGAMELFEAGRELEGRYVKDMRITPVDPAFTPSYLSRLMDSHEGEKKSAKGILTQDQLIPGLGNAIAQDILFRARLHPKRRLAELGEDMRRDLHAAIVGLVEEVAEKGGRNDETDLFGNPGGYARIMDKNAVGKPCPRCGGEVAKIQYLGGACYFCTECQK